MSFTYNSSVVIMWTNTDTKRHYMRYDTSSSTASIIDTTSVLKKSSSSYWSKTSTTKMVKGTSYAGNYTNSNDAWQGRYSFTISSTASLTTTSKMWILSSTKSSITVKLQGWGFSGSAGSWPNVTIYCGSNKHYTQTLDSWQSSGYTFEQPVRPTR